MTLKYLAYNLFKTDYKRLKRYIHQLNSRGVKKLDIFSDIIICLFKYNTYLLDYFHFRYFDQQTPRDFYTNVWDMYRFQSIYNSRKDYMKFRDKRLFREVFDEFFLYDAYIVKNQNEIYSFEEWLTHRNLDRIVAKDPLGAVGKGVKVIDLNNEVEVLNQNKIEFFLNLYKKGYSLFECFIHQHPTLNNLNPGSVNTIRIISFLNEKNEVEIWGALIRIGNNTSIDNFDAGGLGANIDLQTGIINTEAIVKDPFETQTFAFHPVNGNPIKGVQIPFWKEVIDLVIKAAKKVPEVRTVGWDIAITEEGPTLIEGNDNWNRVLFQLATGIGLNQRIKEYLKSSK